MSGPTFFEAITGTVEPESGIIRGVSVATIGQAKGHGVLIDQTTLQTIKNCADEFKNGVRVKVDHGTGFENIVGCLKSFRIEGNQLKADLYLLKTHEMFSQIVEIAGSMPESVGVSISFSQIIETIDGSNYARCGELYSVDFVDIPAANPNGLFSAPVDSQPKGMAENLTAEKTFVESFKALLGISTPQNFETLYTSTRVELAEFKAEVQTLKTNLEAKSAEVTNLQAKLVELEAGIPARAAALAATQVSAAGIPPVQASTPTNASGSVGFSELVKNQLKDGKKTTEQAVKFCVENFPNEHQAWLRSGNTSKL